MRECRSNMKTRAMKAKKKERVKKTKYGYGVPEDTDMLKDLQLLIDKPCLKDPRIKAMRRRRIKYKSIEKEVKEIYAERHGLSPEDISGETLSLQGERAKILDKQYGHEEDFLRKKDYTLSKTALKHYNSKTEGAKYKLVKCLGSHSENIRGVVYHCNFIAKCTEASAGTSPKLGLFFAELRFRTEVIECEMLATPNFVRGRCSICPKEIAHPQVAYPEVVKGRKQAYWPSPNSYSTLHL